MARLTDRVPRAITTSTAMPTNLRVTIAHPRRLNINQDVLIPETVVAVRLCAGIRHPRSPVNHKHVGIAAGFERKRHGKMSPTRHIREEDFVGSPPIEVSGERNLLSPRGIETEAKE